jgi:putrescine aminotransferase
MESPLITFEQAMGASRRQSAAAFVRHVNPVEGSIFRLAGLDRRYTRAEGIRLYDDEGRTYLDFTGGYGALVLGHNPPEVLEAVRRAASLPSVLLAGFSPLMGALGENLSRLLPGELSMVSFGSGGAEAVELGLKTARAATGRPGIIGCHRSYHGQTFGALSASGSARQGRLVGPLLPACRTIPFGDLAALEEALRGGEAAAFIVEPVQGEGGARVPPPGYLKGAEELCRRHGTLLVLDEIQTGFGRTGRLFALEHERVIPDVVLLSKSLGAGVVPVSVSVTTPAIWRRAFGDRERFDMTISTFGGNPAACAAALKSMEVILREDLPTRAAEMGRYARERLEALKARHSCVREVRGVGLLLGLELLPPGVGERLGGNFTALVVSRLLDGHGILSAYCDLDPTVLRFEPPLIVTREEIDGAVAALDRVLGEGTLRLALSLGRSMAGRNLRGDRKRGWIGKR